jgi:hypothetical protein
MLMKLKDRLASWAFAPEPGGTPLTPHTWHLTPENAGVSGYVDENK